MIKKDGKIYFGDTKQLNILIGVERKGGALQCWHPCLFVHPVTLTSPSHVTVDVPRSNPNKTHVNHCNVVMAAALAPSARYIVHAVDIDFSDMSFEVFLRDTRKGSS